MDSNGSFASHRFERGRNQRILQQQKHYNQKGLTLAQILEVIHAPRRDHGTNNSEKVKTLVKILQAAGEHTPYTYQED